MADNDLGRALGWEDDAQVQESEFVLLDPGVYDYQVVGFERGRFDGSKQMAACNVAKLTLRCTNGAQTGNVFVKDGKTYRLSGKRLQSEMAYKSGVSFEGRAHSFDLRTPLGFPLSDEERRAPFFRAHCDTCGSRPFCSGCSNCGKCEA